METFGTTIAPACTCGGTVCFYTIVNDAVRAQCVSCKRIEHFGPIPDPVSATALREAHEAHQRSLVGRLEK